MKKIVIASVVSVGAILVALLSTTEQALAPKACTANTTPASTFSTIITDPFDPTLIRDPVLKLGVDQAMMERSTYYLDYSSPGSGLAPMRRKLAPSEFQFLRLNDTDEQVVDLRDVEIDQAFGLPRIVVQVPEKGLKKSAYDFSGVESLNARPFNTVDPLMGPNMVIAERLDLPVVESNPTASLLRDAIVLIETDGSFCNGTHLGEGRILTARHCVGKHSRVIFGKVWPDKKNALAGEVVCPATENREWVASVAGGDGRAADIAVLDIDFGKTSNDSIRHFSETSLPIDRLGRPPVAFSLASIWTQSQRPVAIGTDGKPFYPHYLQKHIFRPPTPQPDEPAASKFAWCQAVGEVLRDDCVANEPDGISPRGWVHRCPVVGGLSGAPMFDADAEQIAVVAVVSGDTNDRTNNCATPVFLLADNEGGTP